MCGICGFISYKKIYDKSVINSMVSVMKHRGPNDEGSVTFNTCDYQCSLGHCRLSIMDLSMAGHQPMALNNLEIVYNGEVYNFKEIKDDLIALGHCFASSCDTEVILHAFQQWGTDCVSRFIGMFAFAIYDKDNQKLYLCRDRAGVKPLFYYSKDDTFMFGSELKALMAHPEFKKEVDPISLSLDLQMDFVPRDKAIFKHTKKLLPGSWLCCDLSKRTSEVHTYWDITDWYNKPKLDIPYEEAKSRLREIFKSAFDYRMVADVPVGVFLSGGIDSALLCSILTKELGRKIQTFTIGFAEGNNEAPEAERVAKYLETEHTTRYITKNDVLDLVPQLPYFYDEPYDNPGSLPFMLVSKLAKEKVVCALSADGADEVFAGYYTHSNQADLYEKYYKYGTLPKLLRKPLRRFYDDTKKLFPKLPGKNLVYRMTDADFTHKNLTVRRAGWYRTSIVNSMLSCDICIDAEGYCKDLNCCNDSPEYSLYFDFKTLMPDNYIVKIERGSMWTSLECREPFLDQRIIEFGVQLPWDYKYYQGNKKRILKDLAYDYIPREYLDKPKTGFSAPINQWFRNELKDYVYDILSYSNLKDAHLNPTVVLKLIDDYMKTARGDVHLLWSVLQYIAWYKHWILDGVHRS